jgi:hypothetical protein
MKNLHPIAFESKKLRERERIYSICDKEMSVIMHSLDKFQQYLVGRRFVVMTDHNNLKYFLEKKYLSEIQHKWVSKLQAYEFDIEYVKGKKNLFYDALSRRPSTFSLVEVSINWNYTLLVEYSKNKFFL